MNNIDLLIILSTAFLGSVGHCIGMCGGIVVAYSSTKIDQTSSWGTQTISHLAYNFGRVVTYTILGAMFGLLGKAYYQRGTLCTYRYINDIGRVVTCR